jgi:cell fate regulator YaaT (PSP1 superfamily)
MTHETKVPTRHVVGVEYVKNGRQYTFETEFAVKKGSWLVVERDDGEKVVVQAVTADYNETEEDISKRFDIKRLKKVFGIVTTK